MTRKLLSLSWVTMTTESCSFSSKCTWLWEPSASWPAAKRILRTRALLPRKSGRAEERPGAAGSLCPPPPPVSSWLGSLQGQVHAGHHEAAVPTPHPGPKKCHTPDRWGSQGLANVSPHLGTLEAGRERERQSSIPAVAHMGRVPTPHTLSQLCPSAWPSQ